MLGSILGGAAAGLAGGLMGLGNTLLSSREQRNNAVLSDERQWEYYNKQKELDYKYDQLYNQLDRDFYRWQQDLGYEYAQKYAENSAKWSVTGLENAGLNPILAAQSGNFSNVTNHTSPTNARHVSSSPLPSHIGSVSTSLFDGGLVDTIIRGAKLGDELRQIDVDTKLKTGTLDSQVQSAKADVLLKTAEASRVDALTNSAKADSAVKLAEADKISAEADNERRYGGGHGLFSDTRRSFESLADRLLNSFSESSDSGVVQDKLNNIAGEIKRVTDSKASTAKEVEKSVSDKLKSAAKVIKKSMHNLNKIPRSNYHGFGIPTF